MNELFLSRHVPFVEEGRATSSWKVGKFTFRADFDSANLCKAQVAQGDSAAEFQLWTRRDCEGQPCEKPTRTWFYFGVAGAQAGDFVIMTLMNLNRQSRLYSQDYRPWHWRRGMAEWSMIPNKCMHKRDGEHFQVRFSHKFDSAEETFFAFAIPFSYQDTQAMLAHLDEIHRHLPSAQGPALLRAGGGGLRGSTGSAGLDVSLEDTDLSPGSSGRHNKQGFPQQVQQAQDQRRRHSGAGFSDSISEALSHMGAGSPLPPGSDGGTTAVSRRQSAGGSGGGTDRGALAPAGLASQQQRQQHHGCASSSLWGTDVRDSDVYYCRQLLATSLEGRRVDLLTITDCSGASGERERPPAGVLTPHDNPDTQPVAVFPDKKVFFVSSRVHPGETPATHMFNGLLEFLLRRDDPRAAALRRAFVFKLVPLVNPDGVYWGNYRTDTLGQNLNRYYLGVPNKDRQPSVWAIKQLLLYYARSLQQTLEYYIDLHAHANKKGVFAFGNALTGERHLLSLLYSRMCALNSPVFDFLNCNFTEKNMSRQDKEGESKEGAGRVALFRETGLLHLYTVEANYNMARSANIVPPASGDHGGRASPPSGRRAPPRLTADMLQGAGRALAVSALDLLNANPWSRLPSSEYRSLDGARAWLVSCMKASEDSRAALLPPMEAASLESVVSSSGAAAARATSGSGSGPGGEVSVGRSRSLRGAGAGGAGTGPPAPSRVPGAWGPPLRAAHPTASSSFRSMPTPRGAAGCGGGSQQVGPSTGSHAPLTTGKRGPSLASQQASRGTGTAAGAAGGASVSQAGSLRSSSTPAAGGARALAKTGSASGNSRLPAPGGAAAKSGSGPASQPAYTSLPAIAVDQQRPGNSCSDGSRLVGRSRIPRVLDRTLSGSGAGVASLRDAQEQGPESAGALVAPTWDQSMAAATAAGRQGLGEQQQQAGGRVGCGARRATNDNESESEGGSESGSDTEAATEGDAGPGVAPREPHRPDTCGWQLPQSLQSSPLHGSSSAAASGTAAPPSRASFDQHRKRTSRLMLAVPSNGGGQQSGYSSDGGLAESGPSAGHQHAPPALLPSASSGSLPRGSRLSNASEPLLSSARRRRQTITHPIVIGSPSSATAFTTASSPGKPLGFDSRREGLRVARTSGAQPVVPG